MASLEQPDINKLIAQRDVDGLIKALDPQNKFDVLLAAVSTLGELGDACAVEPLIAALWLPGAA